MEVRAADLVIIVNGDASDARSCKVGKRGAAKTARRAVAGEPKKSFMDSITTDNRPASRTTQKAPEFNRDPNINYAERDIDAKTVKRSMDGVT